MMDTICRRVGKGAFAAMLGDGQNSRIEICEVESIRGRSFDERCFVLIDEAQQTNPEEMLSIITRISDQATLVIMGDNSQRDIPGKSGLAWVTDFFTRHPDPEVGMISFDSPDDVVRSGWVVRLHSILLRIVQIIFGPLFPSNTEGWLFHP